jgi:hypothetical protein
MTKGEAVAFLGTGSWDRGICCSVDPTNGLQQHGHDDALFSRLVDENIDLMRADW